MRIPFPFAIPVLMLALAPLVTAPVQAEPASQPRSAGAVVTPQVSAEGVAIVDDATGRLLYGRRCLVRYAPASLTKIVTAIVALRKGHLADRVNIGVHWEELLESTRMGLTPGEVLTLEDLLFGLMVPSGNDAAVAIARYVGGGEERFAEMMNQAAADLGLRNSHFVNPHGLDADGHYSSACDLAAFGRYGMRNPTFARIVGTKDITIKGRSVYPLQNHNRLLSTYPGADGIKTGFTDNARLAIVVSAVREGRRVLVTVLRSGNHLGEATQLLDYYFQNASWLTNAPPMGAARSVSERWGSEEPGRGSLWVEPPPRWETS